MNWRRTAWKAIGAIVGLQILLNAIYILTPLWWTFNIAEWNLIVISADTSFLALAYGLKAYITVGKAAEKADGYLNNGFVKSVLNGNGNVMTNGGGLAISGSQLSELVGSLTSGVKQINIDIGKDGVRFELNGRKRK